MPNQRKAKLGNLAPDTALHNSRGGKQRGGSLMDQILVPSGTVFNGIYDRQTSVVPTGWSNYENRGTKTMNASGKAAAALPLRLNTPVSKLE